MLPRALGRAAGSVNGGGLTTGGGRLGLGCTALFIIGMSLLYWYQVPDRGLAKTEALPISADPAPTGPRPSGSTVRVLVDARLETVLVEFRPQSGQTPSNFSPARSAQRGDVRCALAPLSDARQICTAGASSVTPPAVHVPAPAACGTFGGWNARLSDRGASPKSVLSR